jgi:hypothetical protein
VGARRWPPAAAMAGGGLRCARAGATIVGFYSRYARVVAYSLHVEATGALRRGTAGLDCDNPPMKIPYYRLRPIHLGH